MHENPLQSSPFGHYFGSGKLWIDAHFLSAPQSRWAALHSSSHEALPERGL